MYQVIYCNKGRKDLEIMKNTKNTQQNEQLVPLGKYFKSVLDDDRFGSSSVTRLSKSIILLYFLY